MYIYIYSYFQETYVYMPTYKVRYSTQICICRKFAKHSHIDMVSGNICVYIYKLYLTWAKLVSNDQSLTIHCPQGIPIFPAWIMLKTAQRNVDPLHCACPLPYSRLLPLKTSPLLQQANRPTALSSCCAARVLCYLFVYRCGAVGPSSESSRSPSWSAMLDLI